MPRPLKEALTNTPRMLCRSLQLEISPKEFLNFDSKNQQQTAALDSGSKIVDDIGHFLEHLDKRNMLDSSKFSVNHFLQLLDHASLYFYILNQTDRAIFIKS